MKNYCIGYIVSGHSVYDGDVWKILSRRDPYQRGFTKFEYLDLADCLILAGADIRSMVEGDEVHIEMFIDPASKSDFLKRLGALITKKYASLGSSSTHKGGQDFKRER